MDAMQPPPSPTPPAVVLQALTSTPDPAFAYPLRLLIDGEPIGVLWGWSVHPLAPGPHKVELFHQSGVIPKASRASVGITLDEANPVLHLVYRATGLGIRRGRVSVGPYAGPGWDRAGTVASVPLDPTSVVSRRGGKQRPERQ